MPPVATDSHPQGERIPESAFEEPSAHGAAPGTYLRLVLESARTSQAQLAMRTGLSTKHINQVIKGLVPLSPETALLLERSLGVPSHVWNDLQAQHQDFLARERSLQQLGQHSGWLKRFPVKELTARGILSFGADEATQVSQLLSFFRVADPAAYDRVWSGPVAAGFRRATQFKVDPYASATWLRLAELRAGQIQLADYSADGFARLLPRIRSLTLVEDDRLALGQLQQLCAAVGVAVVLVPEVKGSRASGAARWPEPTHPMIVLSGRGGYADMFWFSFYHEAAHILLHGKRETYVDLGQDDDEGGREAEANRAAARYFVGTDVTRRLHRGMRHNDIRTIARELGVHPGIIAGQLCKVTKEWQKYALLRTKIDITTLDG